MDDRFGTGEPWFESRRDGESPDGPRREPRFGQRPPPAFLTTRSPTFDAPAPPPNADHGHADQPSPSDHPHLGPAPLKAIRPNLTTRSVPPLQPHPRAHLVVPPMEPPPAPASPAPTPAAAPAPTKAALFLPEQRLREALNPLLSAAAPALALAAALRDRATHEDPDGALELALSTLRRFESDGAAAGLAPEELRVARFALCVTLDDVVRATPWGPRSVWAQAGVADRIDPEAGGPDRLFDLLDTMLGDPRLHLRELELFYACLSLGFEGKYRDKPRGAHDLAHLRDELYRILRRARGDRDPALSPSWRGLTERFRPLGVTVPSWIAWVAVGVALALLYGQLSASLARQAEPVVARLSALLPDGPIEIARLAPPPPPTAGPALIARVTGQLTPEIRSNAVEVLAGEDGALVIRIPAAAMFATGSEVVKARHRAIVDRVGQALAPESGHVMVVAHTDDQTPRTGRFPSAQSLTDARADAVRKLLERSVGPSRLSAEGRADSEPIALNSTPAGRDSNRRIDIRLYPQ
ncbi:type IVB secretion system protein IcmH/DotU [Azospirillum griseum]|uniref:type IVB secretion system protein IcmH/DotU n=1 Tax=Azospirillum griseum TaxID=2496639 RepID=UPI003632DF1E